MQIFMKNKRKNARVLVYVKKKLYLCTLNCASMRLHGHLEGNYDRIYQRNIPPTEAVVEAAGSLRAR